MTSKETAIKGVPLFSSCSKRELALIARLTDEIDFPAGRDLMREGETGREFFIILSGTAEVHKGETVLATIGPGGFCGEMALIDRVTARSPIDALVLLGEAFSGLRSELPNMNSLVLDEMTARLRADAAEG